VLAPRFGVVDSTDRCVSYVFLHCAADKTCNRVAATAAFFCVRPCFVVRVHVLVSPAKHTSRTWLPNAKEINDVYVWDKFADARRSDESHRTRPYRAQSGLRKTTHTTRSPRALAVVNETRSLRRASVIVRISQNAKFINLNVKNVQQTRSPAVDFARLRSNTGLWRRRVTTNTPILRLAVSPRWRLTYGARARVEHTGSLRCKTPLCTVRGLLNFVRVPSNVPTS